MATVGHTDLLKLDTIYQFIDRINSNGNGAQGVKILPPSSTPNYRGLSKPRIPTSPGPQPYIPIIHIQASLWRVKAKTVRKWSFRIHFQYHMFVPNFLYRPLLMKMLALSWYSLHIPCLCFPKVEFLSAPILCSNFVYNDSCPQTILLMSQSP